MSKYTADEMDTLAKHLAMYYSEEASEMVEYCAARLRQDEQEALRDPVTDPRPGDRIEWPVGECVVYDPRNRTAWPTWTPTGATIIRRREVGT